MREILNAVVTLQSKNSAANTPEMSQRGLLVRNDLPLELDALGDDLALAVGIDRGDLITEGRDGTGRKSKVPWARFGSKSRAPTANSGWYIVFLFRPQADGFYLSLMHAATIWNGSSYVRRPDEQISPLMDWARELFQVEFSNHSLIKNIDLESAKNTLPASYERSSALAKLYLVDSLPDNQTLRADLLLFAKMLGRVYGLDDKGLSPSEAEHQRLSAQAQIQEIESGRTRRGSKQGFGLSGPQRKCIELQAMDLARAYLEREGYRVKDVSATESCDFLATKPKTKIYVEVKGTTGRGEGVILTKNEILLHQAKYPKTMLIIVSAIDLDRSVNPPIANGGSLKVIYPWEVFDERLTALSYQYLV